MTPEQFDPKRILRKDVQSLLRLVSVSPDTGFSAEFPGAMPTAISVKLRGGTTIEGKRKDYEGFFTRPMSWNKAVDKFEKLASRSASRQSRSEVTEIVSELDSVRIKELTKALRSIQTKKGS